MNNLQKIFMRSTNSNKFIVEIDGLRFYAIMTVVVFHLNTAFSREIGLNDLGISLLGGKESFMSLGWWIVRLDLGVKVFFSISGFVLALPFINYYLKEGSKVNLVDYFYRRLTRLEPPFVVSLIMFFLVHQIILGASTNELFPHLLAGLIYAHVFIYGVPNPINPVSWSLETEAQFYAIAPMFFALLFSNRKSGYFLLIVILSFITSIYLRNYFIQNNISHLSTSIFAYFSNFLTGILFAWWYISNEYYFKRKHFIWDLVGLICIFGQFYFYKPQYLWSNNLLFNIFVLGFMISAFKGKVFNRIFTQPIIYIIGGMCYSIYLLHYAFFHLIVKFTPRLDSNWSYVSELTLQIFTCIPIILIISSGFYLLIEKPCMNKYWPKRFVKWIKFRRN